VLNKINLSIKKNSTNCIIGESGSGKSTLLDILMGLLDPNEGKILVDDKVVNLNNSNWQNKIGFVSQNIYITNNTLRENIAFGYDENEIDDKKITSCLEICNLSEFAKNLKNGLNTKLSDLGTNISGGQKQRLGIARALYSNPEILVLDEPTNNLDEKNEQLIINNLLNLEEITLIITTHKNELKKNFDNIFEVKENKVTKLTKDL
jgi:ABC-type bacteriocin/lantibiotic exporter with double-glycine peptidase domain